MDEQQEQQPAGRDAIERDLGWVLHLGKENAPTSLELVDRLATHCRQLLTEVGGGDTAIRYLENAVEGLQAEVDALKLLLIRKSEALAVFASPNLWVQWVGDTGEGCPRTFRQWNGAAEYADPQAFARRESEADQPCD